MRVFTRTQLPFLIGCFVITVGAAIIDPRYLATPAIIAAWAIIATASTAAIALPWERAKPIWMMPVAVADLAAVALIHADLLSVIPATGVLAVLPVLWLAYGFGSTGIVVAIVGTLFITTLPYLTASTWPQSGQDWVNISVMPMMIVLVAVMVHIAARQLRRSHRRSLEATARLNDSYGQAVDRSILTRSILDTVNATVLFYDADHRLVISNRRAVEMSAYVGRPIEEVLSTPAVGGDIRVLGADRETPLPASRFIVPRALGGEEMSDELQWVGRPDAQIGIMVSSRRVRRRDGEVIGTAVVAHEVTELAHALELSENFLKTVSHELRTPLTSITGYTDLIDDALPPEDHLLRGHLAAVQRNVGRLTARVSELLSDTACSESLSLEETDLGVLVGSAVRTARADAESRGITLEHLTADTAVAAVDRRLMLTVVNELITNAVKFGAPHSAVTIGQRTVGDRVHLTVVDQGPGIPAADHARIFDRFYRTSHARRNAVQGFGLGLTQARSTIAAHGGRLLVDSRVGEGARFTVDLPAAPPVDERRIRSGADLSTAGRS